MLIEAGADINTRECQKATPLFKATCAGNLNFVEWALARGATVNAANIEGHTPLLEASARGYNKILSLLIQHGATYPTTTPETGWGPLGIAADNNHFECVRILPQKGANPNLKGGGGNTASAVAVWNGHTAILAAKIEAGADVEVMNDCGYTLISLVAADGRDEVVRLLANAGAKLDAKGNGDKNPAWGVTPLMRAARVGHASTVGLLAALGADVEARDAKGNTSLRIAASQQRHEVVVALLARDAIVDAANGNGNKASHAAALKGNIQTVSLLLHSGADHRTRDIRGRTAWICTVHARKDMEQLQELQQPEPE